MKAIFSLLMLVSVSGTVTSASDQTTDLSTVLSKYWNYGDGCRIETLDGKFMIRSEAAGGEVLKTTLMPLRPISKGAYFFVEDRAYLGVATTYLIPKDGRLSVIMTWKDTDGGVDRSLFCDLYEK